MEDKKRINRNAEEKASVVHQVQARLDKGEGTGEACKSVGINPTQFYSWRSELRAKSLTARVPRRIDLNKVTPPTAPAVEETELPITVFVFRGHPTAIGRSLQRMFEGQH